MRGSPLLRAFLVLLALLALILPLRRLTSRQTAPAIAVSSPPPDVASMQLVLISTSTPFHFQISHLGQVIWQGDSTQPRLEKTLRFSFPPEGVDLVFKASWPETKESALRVELTPADQPPIVRTLWGMHEVDEVATFKSPNE
jgi:hypothetical protein